MAAPPWRALVRLPGWEASREPCLACVQTPCVPAVLTAPLSQSPPQTLCAPLPLFQVPSSCAAGRVILHSFLLLALPPSLTSGLFLGCSRHSQPYLPFSAQRLGEWGGKQEATAPNRSRAHPGSQRKGETERANKTPPARFRVSGCSWPMSCFRYNSDWHRDWVLLYCIKQSNATSAGEAIRKLTQWYIC